MSIFCGVMEVPRSDFTQTSGEQTVWLIYLVIQMLTTWKACIFILLFFQWQIDESFDPQELLASNFSLQNQTVGSQGQRK